MYYYGANDHLGADMRPHEMAIEACQQLDPTVDFSQYDRDGDGLIDNVFLYYAGRGEATGGASSTVWPHSWTLSVADPDNIYEFDGVRLESYGCTNEWDVNNGVERPDAIGIFVHEFSHVLGLPDLYNTLDQNSGFTPGAWSTLDAGPYNNGSNTPPHYGAFERYALGWMQPEVIDRPATVSLSSIGSNKALLIPTEKEEEYFLLENRQQEGWDKYLPGHGLLIWHIDYDPAVWEHNAVNNRASHPYVDLEEADNLRTNETRAGDAFPGTAGITSFTDDTAPSMLPWTNKSLNLPVTDITENADGTVSLLIGGGFVLPSKVWAYPAADTDFDRFTASWDPAEHADGYRLSVKSAGDDASPLPEWDDRDLGNILTAEVTGLEPEKEYVWQVTPYNRCGDGEKSDPSTVITPAYTFDRRTPVVLEATDVTKDSFVACWEEMEDAAKYILDVYTKTVGTTATDICDFTAGTKASELPEGWKSSSETSFAMASYAGEAVPSLRMGNDGDVVETPEYAEGITGVSFWVRPSGTDAEARVVVSGNAGGQWVELHSVDVSPSSDGRTVAISDLPDDITALRISFAKEGKGSLALDDIAVTYCTEKYKVGDMTYEIEAAPGLTSYRVDGLIPSTNYFYQLSASDGTLTSRCSGEISVRTSQGAGLTAPAGSEAIISVAGQTVVIGNAAGQPVEVTDLSGRVLFAAAVADSATIALPAPGCYIIRVGAKTSKIIL